MVPIHITIGTGSDPDYLWEKTDGGRSIRWPVPKSAQPGDWVLFLLPSLSGDIVALGTVKGPTAKSKNWTPKYAAQVGEVRRLVRPILVGDLVMWFPNWKYPTYARSYTTVPDEFAGELRAEVEESLKPVSGGSPN